MLLHFFAFDQIFIFRTSPAVHESSTSFGILALDSTIQTIQSCITTNATTLNVSSCCLLHGLTSGFCLTWHQNWRHNLAFTDLTDIAPAGLSCTAHRYRSCAWPQCGETNIVELSLNGFLAEKCPYRFLLHLLHVWSANVIIYWVVVSCSCEKHFRPHRYKNAVVLYCIRGVDDASVADYAVCCFLSSV